MQRAARQAAPVALAPWACKPPAHPDYGARVCLLGTLTECIMAGKAGKGLWQDKPPDTAQAILLLRCVCWSMHACTHRCCSVDSVLHSAGSVPSRLMLLRDLHSSGAGMRLTVPGMLWAMEHAVCERRSLRFGSHCSDVRQQSAIALVLPAHTHTHAQGHATWSKCRAARAAGSTCTCMASLCSCHGCTQQGALLTAFKEAFNGVA